MMTRALKQRIPTICQTTGNIRQNEEFPPYRLWRTQ